MKTAARTKVQAKAAQAPAKETTMFPMKAETIRTTKAAMSNQTPETTTKTLETVRIIPAAVPLITIPGTRPITTPHPTTAVKATTAVTVSRTAEIPTDSI